MASATLSGEYQFPPGGYGPSVSPWRQILLHYAWLTRRRDLDEIFGGLRAFVAGACDAPGLAGRFVFPSTINMSIFRGPNPVDYLQDPMPRRFIVSPLGQ